MSHHVDRKLGVGISEEQWGVGMSKTLRKNMKGFAYYNRRGCLYSS